MRDLSQQPNTEAKPKTAADLFAALREKHGPLNITPLARHRPSDGSRSR